MGLFKSKAKERDKEITQALRTQNDRIRAQHSLFTVPRPKKDKYELLVSEHQDLEKELKIRQDRDRDHQAEEQRVRAKAVKEYQDREEARRAEAHKSKTSTSNNRDHSNTSDNRKSTRTTDARSEKRDSKSLSCKVVDSMATQREGRPSAAQPCSEQQRSFDTEENTSNDANGTSSSDKDYMTAFKIGAGCLVAATAGPALTIPVAVVAGLYVLAPIVRNYNNNSTNLRMQQNDNQMQTAIHTNQTNLAMNGNDNQAKVCINHSDNSRRVTEAAAQEQAAMHRARLLSEEVRRDELRRPIFVHCPVVERPPAPRFLPGPSVQYHTSTWQHHQRQIQYS